MLFQILFPETPMFLLQRGQDERAKESLKFYRNYEPKTKESATHFEIEFEKLKTDVTSHQANTNTVTWHDFCKRVKLNKYFTFSNNYLKFSLPK